MESFLQNAISVLVLIWLPLRLRLRLLSFNLPSTRYNGRARFGVWGASSALLSSLTFVGSRVSASIMGFSGFWSVLLRSWVSPSEPVESLPSSDSLWSLISFSTMFRICSFSVTARSLLCSSRSRGERPSSASSLRCSYRGRFVSWKIRDDFEPFRGRFEWRNFGGHRNVSGREG